MENNTDNSINEAISADVSVKIKQEHNDFNENANNFEEINVKCENVDSANDLDDDDVMFSEGEEEDGNNSIDDDVVMVSGGEEEFHNYEKPMLVTVTKKCVKSETIEEKFYNCRYCERKFSKLDPFLEHCLVHRRRVNNLYGCPSCEMDNLGVYHYYKHLLAKHYNLENAQLQCNICGMLSLKENYLNEHIKKMHLTEDNQLVRYKNPKQPKKKKKLRFFCTQCPFATIYQRIFKEHGEKHSQSEDPSLEKCKYCSYKNTKGRLYRHLILHPEYRKQVQRKNLIWKRELGLVTAEEENLLDCTSPEELKEGQDHEENGDTKEEVNEEMVKIEDVEEDEGDDNKERGEIAVKIEENIVDGSQLVTQIGNKLFVWNCIWCQFTTQEKQDFVPHLLSHTPKIGKLYYKCPTCSKKIPMDIFPRHVIKHYSNIDNCNIKCSQCNFVSFDSTTLKIHSIGHKRKESLNKSDVKSDIWKKITKLSSGVTVFECKHCSYFATDEKTFRQHSLKHVKITDFGCEFCPFVTKRRCEMTIHIKKHNMPDDSTWKSCRYCTFRSITLIKDHEELHLEQVIEKNSVPNV